jgi:hypothetical protein
MHVIQCVSIRIHCRTKPKKAKHNMKSIYDEERTLRVDSLPKFQCDECRMKSDLTTEMTVIG